MEITKKMMAVSIPHRYGTTYFRRKSVMKKNRKNVSIPHRYGTTNMEASSSYFSAKASANSCRFLIGTVQLNSLIRNNDGELVSIPHRYGTTFESLQKAEEFAELVSIPHRYGTTKNIN